MSIASVSKIRIVTAASLFDGHDAAINIMRRIMQSKGAEIIHLGHNRSVAEIVECAIEEDVQGIAVTSYQGGHIEFFKYMKDLLNENGAGHIKIFGGGGGTILPSEIEVLHGYGITRIYSPDDGRHMGLEGMIEDVLKQCSSPLQTSPFGEGFADAQSRVNGNGKYALGEWRDIKTIAKAITLAENGEPYKHLLNGNSNQIASGDGKVSPKGGDLEGAAPVLGITGTGGAGKSSVTDEIVRRFLNAYTDKTIAVISVDPSKKKTGGALLGDRIRMNSIHHPRAYMRSLATRESDKTLSSHVQEAIDICKAAGYNIIILESAGVGQGDASILDHCDISMYVMTPEYGAASQLEKINMLDYADIICVNKFDKAGAKDAIREVQKQYKRNHSLWQAKDDELPVIGTIASKFNDEGINKLFEQIIKIIENKTGIHYGNFKNNYNASIGSDAVIPAKRIRYLAEIAEAIITYNTIAKEQSVVASQLYQVNGTLQMLSKNENTSAAKELEQIKNELERQLTPENKHLLDEWENVKSSYQKEFFEYNVRGKINRLPLFFESLSHTKIPKIAIPQMKDWGDILQWRLQENFPGHFPYTAGVFPLKRQEEDPTRMFAGEGGPERTNRRFHYVSYGQAAKRLSTAFDSVTLYGEDPASRPDIYGKVGNSGVSIATVDDAKKLYSGFDLCDAKTSVSMTINGPAPMILAFFLNAAIDQQCEKYIRKNSPSLTLPEGKRISPQYSGELPPGNDGLGLELLGLSGSDVLPKDVYEEIKAKALANVRGTVQADILKEDQAQNTCIHSITKKERKICCKIINAHTAA